MRHFSVMTGRDVEPIDISILMTYIGSGNDLDPLILEVLELMLRDTVLAWDQLIAADPVHDQRMIHSVCHRMLGIARYAGLLSLEQAAVSIGRQDEYQLGFPKFLIELGHAITAIQLTITHLRNP